MKNERYIVPEIEIINNLCDIITYSESEQWEGPVIDAGMPAEE